MVIEILRQEHRNIEKLLLVRRSARSFAPRIANMARSSESGDETDWRSLLHAGAGLT